MHALIHPRLQVQGGSNWSQVQFSLTPKADAECVGISYKTAVAQNIGCPSNNTYNASVPMSDRTAHVCVQCGGQFRVALLSADHPVQVDLSLTHSHASGPRISHTFTTYFALN